MKTLALCRGISSSPLGSFYFLSIIFFLLKELPSFQISSYINLAAFHSAVGRSTFQLPAYSTG
jgi:hypothetical protein